MTSRSDLWSLLVKTMFCSWLIRSSFSIRSICSSADFFSALNKGSICKIFFFFLAGLSLAIHLKDSIDLGFQILLTLYIINIYILYYYIFAQQYVQGVCTTICTRVLNFTQKSQLFLLTLPAQNHTHFQSYFTRGRGNLT